MNFQLMASMMCAVDYDYYGYRRDGAMAEYLAVKKENLCLLPDGGSYEEVTDGLGADACIEGTGAALPWADCISLAKAGGRVVCLGNPFGGMSLTQEAYWKILRKELTLVGTWNSSFGSRENDWRAAVKAMQDKRLDLKSLITHRFSLAEYQEAFSLMHERREMYCKVMFVM